MSKLIATVFVCTLAISLTIQVQGQQKRMRPDAHSKPSGGIVEKPYSGNFFRIIDAQHTVQHDAIKQFALKMRLETLLAFETRSHRPVMLEEATRIAQAVLKEPQTGCDVVIVDDPTREVYIESAESRWAILNLAPLKADKPTPAKLEMRCGKVLWRAAARALGVGYSNHDVSVLMPFSSLSELDANHILKPAPDGINSIMKNAEVYGLTPLTIASYRTACRNGWAPSPSNDVQKAIWAEIHQIPDKPLAIEYDPKKDR